MKLTVVLNLMLIVLLAACSSDMVKRASYNAIKLNQCNRENTLMPPDCYRSYDQEYEADQKAMREYQESLKDETSAH